MPGEEEDVDAARAGADVLAQMRANTVELRRNTEELERVRGVFEKILSAGPVQRAEPIMRGAVPGTVPLAQIMSAGADLARALNSGGRPKKKKRREEEG